MRTKFPPRTLKKNDVLFTFTRKNNNIEKKYYFIKNQFPNLKSFTFYTSLGRKKNPYAGNNDEQYNRTYLYAAHPASSLNFASLSPAPAPETAGPCPCSTCCYCNWCANCCFQTTFAGCPGDEVLCGCGNESNCGPC